MSRIIIPVDYTSQRTLFTDIKKKNDADGGTSVLKPFLAQQSIDLAVDATNGDTADTHEASRALLSKQSENYSQLRDVKFDPAFSHLRSEVQFLKKLYANNIGELGNWGITVNNGGKIVYPTMFKDRVNLFNTFKKKHDSFPAGTSPLQPFLDENAIDINKDATNVTTADGYNTQFTTASKSAEDETQQRDLLWDPIMGHVRLIGDFLKGLYPDNAKKLGDWGFVVDNSPQKPKVRTSNLKIGETITVTGVTIGGTFTNTGSGDLHVYRGKTTTGTPTIVHAGEQLGMTKGYSVITVVNPSTLVPGKFTVLRH